MTLIAEDTGLHTYQIIHRSLLPVCVIALLLELLCLQKIAWVILITDRQRYKMQLLQTLDDTAFSTHRHHLQNTLLGAVVAILGSTLSLGNPDILILLLDGEMHVIGKTLARHEHLAHTQGTLHDKRLVDTNQVLDPRKRQKVVTDGNLAGGLEAIIDKHYIEDS